MSVSLCVLRVEIDEELPEMSQNPSETEAVKEQKRKDRGARDSKTITVETYANVLMGTKSVDGLLPTSSRKSPEASASENSETINFFCGNPLVEVTKGVIHLYKENELRDNVEAKTLCLLAVPGTLGASDLLAFVAACQDDIAHVRILRDGSPDHYMALLTFRSSGAAREFHAAFDGAPYSSLEPGALCHAAWVARADWAASGAAPPAATELPTCPVCLERMDESVAAVLSVQCAHAFHADCLTRWRHARCPVCRAAQTPEPRARAACLACGDPPEGESEEGREGEGGGVAEGLPDGLEAGSLWICLICGHVGCGRYEKGHAAKHFLSSNHTYALQLGSNRVWDYAGDRWVHRLMQNKADGKLVATDSASTDKALEFTYLLTHQLDEQRAYYDDRIAKLVAEREQEVGAERERALAAERDAAAARAALAPLERRLAALAARVSSLQSALSEERSLGAALASSQAQWQTRARQREEELTAKVEELQEQLRDVMFFVEARDKLEQQSSASAAELAAAHVSVPPPRPRRRRRQ